jgi:hypothetical protein
MMNQRSSLPTPALLTHPERKGRTTMSELVLQLHPCATTEDVCAFCGRATPRAGGPQLRLADQPEVVCRDCGKKHAPSLVALLDLVRTAERVGRICRHTVSPPMTALLDLARAAETYTSTTPRPLKQAA